MSTVQRIPATPSTIQLRMNTRVAEPIPLGRLDSPPDEDDAASATDTAVQGDTNTATANTTVPSPQDQTNAPPPPTPTRRLSPVQSFARGAGFTNSLGTLALVAVVVFGIGAWVGMKIQISQGGKNMDLAIWTACADHEAIQDTALCKSILAKDFSQFEKRKERATEVETQLVKRGLAEDVTTTPGADTGDVMSAEKSEEEKKKPPGLSRYGKLLSGMSSTDRALVHTEPQVYTEQEHPPDPALRATFLPVVNLLTKPITAFFEFVEYMFLVVIYFVHKIFSWITSAFMLVNSRLGAWIRVFMPLDSVFCWRSELMIGFGNV